MSESEGQNKTGNAASAKPVPLEGPPQGATLLMDSAARRPLQDGAPPSGMMGRAGPEGGESGHGIDEARIMARVRGLYQELLEEPVPPAFVRLIRALEEKERSK